MSDLETLVVEMMSGDLEAAVRWINGPKDWLCGSTPKAAWESLEGRQKVVNYIDELSKGAM